MVLCKRENVEELDSEGVLLQLAGPLIDEILFPSLAGGWVRAKSYNEAKEKHACDRLSRLLQRVQRKFCQNFLGVLASRALHVWARLRGMDRAMARDEQQAAFNAMDVVLFDIHEEKKPYMRPLLLSLTDKPKFSLCHGIDIKVKISLVSSGAGMRAGGVRVVLYSEQEREYYKAAFNLLDDNLVVLGIPRHEPAWVRRVIESDKDAELFQEPGYIFVISRPGGSAYFSEDRRCKALEDVRRLAFDHLGVKVVVKLHPKEHWDGAYEEIFGKEHYGKKWIYSRAHPFHIAQGALMAVAFYSGVPSDMTAMGVPTVELLDLRGIPEYDNEEAQRDETGEPVLNIRYWGLVLGASDYAALKTWADAIVRDRQAVVEKLQRRYHELFAVVDSPSQTIARQVLEAAAKGCV